VAVVDDVDDVVFAGDADAECVGDADADAEAETVVDARSGVLGADEVRGPAVTAALAAVLLVAPLLHGCVPARVAPATSTTTAAIHHLLTPRRVSVPCSRRCLMQRRPNRRTWITETPYRGTNFASLRVRVRPLDIGCAGYGYDTTSLGPPKVDDTAAPVPLITDWMPPEPLRNTVRRSWNCTPGESGASMPMAFSIATPWSKYE